MTELIAQLAAMAFNWPDLVLLVIIAFGARFGSVEVDIWIPPWLRHPDQ